MRVRLLLIAMACLLVGATAYAGDDIFKLYLVRHAEKQADGSRDPALTAQGQQRAVDLATWLKDKNIDDIYSSSYRRTIDTAQPLATELGLLLFAYDPGNQPLLVERLLARQDNALIVGHSNTIPELARMLCECEVADMDETEYDRLIVIT
ncbi:MAG: histidine phosphatase family protein, partial [Xanthomonadales bacterium]|nr:histidine phosphatase family protein [Xanthomonadales bacterium]